MKNKSRIAAIVSNYNHSKFFSKSLIPILNQTVPFDEILICDDNSTDGSIEKLKSLKKKFSFIKVFFNKKNKGVIENFNFLINMSKSDYIFLVSTNDTYEKEIVETFKNATSSYSNLGMICAKSNENDKVSLEYRYKKNSTIINACEISPKNFKNIIVKGRYRFFSGANILRRKDFIKFGLLEHKLKWNADWFIYYLFALNTNFLQIDNLFATISFSNDQYSSQSKNSYLQNEVIINLLNILKSKHMNEYHYFQKGCILPSYDKKVFFKLIRHDIFVKFISLKLLYYFLFYNLFKKFSIFIPNKLHGRLRKIFKI